MTIHHPCLPGVSPRLADVFVRDRILRWRRECRGPGRVVRLTLLAASDLALAGDPTETTWWEAPAGTMLDAGSRAEVAGRLLAAYAPEEPLIGLWERPGPNEIVQSDHDWLAATAAAAREEHGVRVDLLVVTRWGWQTPSDGRSRTWKRLRAR